MELTISELLDVNFYFHQSKRPRFFEDYRSGSIQITSIGVLFRYSRVFDSCLRRMVLLPSHVALRFTRTSGKRNCVAKRHPVRLLLERLEGISESVCFLLCLVDKLYGTFGHRLFDPTSIFDQGVESYFSIFRAANAFAWMSAAVMYVLCQFKSFDGKMNNDRCTG